jgi:endonuclease-3
MATASSIKASEKQAICKKLSTALKKKYGGSTPNVDLPVMESLIFAACLENETYERAQEYYDRLLEIFHDWNEVRVSSISELEAAFEGMADPDWRALRVRSALQYVFEKNYVFEFEGIRKKTQDLAARQLGKIPYQSPFVINWVMQNALDTHLVPLDDYMRDAAVVLGLLERKETAGDGAEALKAALRKADVPLFVALLKSFSVDPKVREVIVDELEASDEEFDPTEATDRLDEIFAAAKSGKRKKKKKKTTTRKSKAKKPAKTSARKKSAAKKTKSTTRKTQKKTAASAKSPARKK